MYKWQEIASNNVIIQRYSMMVLALHEEDGTSMKAVASKWKSSIQGMWIINGIAHAKAVYGILGMWVKSA